MFDEADELGEVENAVHDLGDLPARTPLQRCRQLRHDAIGVFSAERRQRHFFDMRIDVLLEALDVVLNGGLLVDVVRIHSMQLATRPPLGKLAERDGTVWRLLRRFDSVEFVTGNRIDLASKHRHGRGVRLRGELDDLLDELTLLRGAQPIDPRLHDVGPCVRFVERRAPGQELRAALLWGDGDAHVKLAAVFVRAARCIADLHGRTIARYHSQENLRKSLLVILASSASASRTDP